jgi:hypothetical protein
MERLSAVSRRWQQRLRSSTWTSWSPRSGLNFQYYIDMERVYEKLPVKEFFTVLRCVQGVESGSRWYRVSGIDIQGRLLRKLFFFFLEPNFPVGDDVFLLTLCRPVWNMDLNAIALVFLELSSSGRCGVLHGATDRAAEGSQSPY